jgi:hypothetical protein
MAKAIYVWDGTQFVPANVPVAAVPDSVAAYSSASPVNATVGQVWFDTNINNLKIWSGSSWIQVTSDLSGYAELSGATFTGTITAPTIVSDTALTSTGLTTLGEITEILTPGTISSNVFTANASSGNIFYITTAPSANFTINITNLPTTDNRVFSFSFFVIQGATGYIPNALQIGGASQTIKWSGGSAPPPTSGVGKVDVFNFTLIRRSSTWEALGDVSKNY